MKVHGHQRGSIKGLLDKTKALNINLRWGGPQVADAINGKVHLLNGLQQLQAFTKTGVPTIQYTTSRDEAEKWVRAGKIVFGRNVDHTQGKDIVLPGDRARWPGKDYWVMYEKSDEEWRFHILNGACIARGVKTFPGNMQGLREPFIRSRRLGWRLNHAIDPPEGLRTIAKQATKAVGYELGAVDMLFSEAYGGKVLEVNSRPAIRDDYTTNQYVKYLGKMATGAK